jgi:hypothetical protein
MTHDERLALAPGDRVTVRRDHGNETEHVVRQAPWQLGHGTWVIGLTGISGGYALDRVVRWVPGVDVGAGI